METLNCCVVRAVQVRLTVTARRLAAAVVGAAVLTLALAAVAAPGAGATPGVAGSRAQGPGATCSAPVVDTSGTIDEAAVTRAVSAETRARIVVRAYQVAPNGRLTDATNDLLAACFTGPGNRIDPQVAVLAFSVDDRQTDVYLGQSLPGAPLPNELQTAMTDGFKASRFTDGVLAAVGRLGLALDDAVGPLPTAAGAAATAVNTPAPDAASVGTVSTDSTSVTTGVATAASDAAGGTVLSATGSDVRRSAPGAGDNGGEVATPADQGSGSSTGVLLAGAAGAGVALIVGAGTGLVVVRRRRLNGMRRDLDRSRIEPLVRAAAISERNQRLDARAEVWSAATTGRTRSVIDDVRRAAREAGAATGRHVALLEQATPRGVAKAGSGELELAAARLANLVACLDADQRALDTLDGLGARLDHLRVALPAKRELLYGEVAAAETLSDQRHGEGWKVEAPEAALTRIRALLDSLDPAAPMGDLLELSDRMEGVEADLFATTHDLQSLPDRPGSIIAWRERQTEAAELEERRAEALIAKLAEVTAGHAPESWQGLSGHPDRALALIREATERAEAAVELARSEQRFDDAGKALEDAGLDLMAADELLDQVDDLLVDLRRARAEAPGIVAQGRQAVAELNAFVDRNRADLASEVVAAPARMEAVLDGLEHQLRSARPNFLRVARGGDQVNREADQILVTVRPAEDQVAATGRQAARETERAAGALSRAREALGWELVASGDGQVLDDLDTRLAGLPEDPAQRIAAARLVADQALVAQERIIAHRRRRGGWMVVGAGTGGWRSGGWSPGTAVVAAGSGRGNGAGADPDVGGAAGNLSFRGPAGTSFGGGRASGGW